MAPRITCCPRSRREAWRLSFALLNLCIQIVNEATQAWRRRRVVEVARAFSVVIDTDIEMPELETGASATFRHESSMPATLARMRSCRAVVSVSNLSDLMHNRTLNGLNAGCVNIVEDNVVHRRVFKHGVNALLLRSTTTACGTAWSWSAMIGSKPTGLPRRGSPCGIAGHSGSEASRDSLPGSRP